MSNYNKYDDSVERSRLGEYYEDMVELRDMKSPELLSAFEQYDADRDLAPMLEYFYSYVITYDIREQDFQFASYVDFINLFYSYASKIKSGNNTTDKVYPYTNENLKELFRNLDINGKRLLTVGSSADQALNGVLYGASEVDLIDANIFTPFMTNLKVAAIKNLSREEFVDFCNNIRENTLKYYPKISHDLPEKYQVFFDTIMLEGYEHTFSEFIYNCSCTTERQSNSAFYTDDEAYYTLQDRLCNDECKINFIHAGLEEFAEKSNGKYDVILLSNIIDYFSLKGRHSYKDINEFFDGVRALYFDRLNENGVMQITSRDFSYDGETCMKVVYDFIQDIDADSFTINDSGMGFITDRAMYYPSIMVKKPPQNQSEKE